MTINHELNGPFVRAAHEATPSGQTETVYALRATYAKGEPLYVDVRDSPFDPEQLRKMQTDQWWSDKRRGRALIDQVSRQVTITATDWEATP